MVEFYLLTFPRFPLRNKEHKSYFGKNRTHDFRTSRCAAYLLDHSGDERLQMYNIILVDLSPTFYCLPKPLLVHGSMLLLSTLILSSYSIIVVMLGWDWGLRMVINITCFKIPGSGFIFAASEYPSMTNKEIIQYTNVLFTQAPILVCLHGTNIDSIGLYS